jgi:hypothetical protein
MRIFFDTEFSDTGMNPRLISIGLVDETGARTFYAELSDTYSIDQCSDFVRETVLPLLEGGEARMTLDQLTVRLGDWLDDFNEPITLATDSLSWDWPWIQRIFAIPGAWPPNLESHPLLLTMNYLDDLEKFEAAKEQGFKDGLRRHHALDDAKANRLGWIAAGGDIDAPAVLQRKSAP